MLRRPQARSYTAGGLLALVLGCAGSLTLGAEGASDEGAPLEERLTPAGELGTQPRAPDQTISDSLFLQTTFGPTFGMLATSPAVGFHHVFNTKVLTIEQRPYPGEPELVLWHNNAGVGNGTFLRAPLQVSPHFDHVNGSSDTLRVGAPFATFSVRGQSGARLALLAAGAGPNDVRLEVDNFSGTTASRNLLKLRNNGAATFRFENAATNQAWGFGGLGTGNFFVGSTPGQPLAFQLTPAGDVTITGTLTQLSDRRAKGDIAPVDGALLLDRLAALPLATWSYLADPGRARHLGPMAQDFAAAFGLGRDDTHVAPSDVAGVSLAAAQALQQQNQVLQRELAALAARLAALEQRVTPER